MHADVSAIFFFVPTIMFPEKAALGARNQVAEGYIKTQKLSWGNSRV